MKLLLIILACSSLQASQNNDAKDNTHIKKPFNHKIIVTEEVQMLSHDIIMLNKLKTLTAKNMLKERNSILRKLINRDR